jgi:GNAT superfamily N-acetyltransferase
MTIEVSKAGPADKADWHLLWREWQAHMRAQVPDQITEQAWNLLCDGTSGLHALIARNGGREAVGFAHVSTTPFAWTASQILYLQDFFIAEAERGRGTGEVLLKAVYGFAEAIGASQVFWMVDANDERLQAFYGRHAVKTPYLRYMREQWPW